MQQGCFDKHQTLPDNADQSNKTPEHAAMTIPGTLADINSAWVADQLGVSPGTLTGIRLEPMGEGVGAGKAGIGGIRSSRARQARTSLLRA